MTAEAEPRRPASARVAASVLAFHRELEPLCVERLRDALNPGTGLFDRQLRDKRWQPTRGTEDLTGTAIGLIGVHRAGVQPERVGLDPPLSLSALAEATRRHAYVGGLGLVIWANAIWSGVALDELAARCRVPLGSLGGRLASLTTMEIAWLVAGLLHEQRRAPSGRTDSCLMLALAELHDRYDHRTSLFWHASKHAAFSRRLRRAVPNFADQIYSVQAAALAAAAGVKPQALVMAEASAQRLAALQGDLGQWWWHYDARSGRVAQGFPVYSVHQYAMAPMALLALSAAGGDGQGGRIEAGYRWLRQNELGLDLVDSSAGTVWRDIEPATGRLARVVRNARSVMGGTSFNGSAGARRLKVNFETRPYEWGWCLFAGAVASGTRRAEHVV